MVGMGFSTISKVAHQLDSFPLAGVENMKKLAKNRTFHALLND